MNIAHGLIREADGIYGLRNMFIALSTMSSTARVGRFRILIDVDLL